MKTSDINTEGVKKLRDATLVFLIRKLEGEINELCLAMKKRGFGMNRWNGVGGKVEKDESLENATKREAKEEINVDINKMEKVAELSFYFPHKPEWNQIVHTYFSEDWEGEPTESEEMKPEWFFPNNLPFDSMWPDDIFWVPEVLTGKKVIAKFVFGERDVILEKEINIVDVL